VDRGDQCALGRHIVNGVNALLNEAKRRTNLRKHGFDFADAEEVFAGVTCTIEDSRFDYGEQRFVTLGMLRDTVVVMSHTETPQEIRIISMRKATRNEQTLYQTLINEALKQAIERESLEDTLRRVIREETAVYETGAGKK